MLQVLRPDNRQTTYERDAFGRINRADHSDGSWEAFSYDKGAYSAELPMRTAVLFSNETIWSVSSQSNSSSARGHPRMAYR